MPKKTKFAIPEIPKTFPSREEKIRMTTVLETELQTARSAALKAATLARDLEYHKDQVFAAFEGARNARVSAKKKASA